MLTEGSYGTFIHINIGVSLPIVPYDRRIILIRVTLDGVKVAIMGGEF